MINKMTVMILPVGLNCNMECAYCYHAGKNLLQGKIHRMSDKILEKIIFESSQLAKTQIFFGMAESRYQLGLITLRKLFKLKRKLILLAEFAI